MQIFMHVSQVRNGGVCDPKEGLLRRTQALSMSVCNATQKEDLTEKLKHSKSTSEVRTD